MLLKTRELRKMFQKDVLNLTDSTKEYYKSKWESLLESATTNAQKKYCKNVLESIDIVKGK